MAKYEVRSMSVRECQKRLVLVNKEGGESSFSVHRFAMVGPGDEITLIASATNAKLTMRSKSDSTEIVVLPRFESHKEVSIGAERLNIVFAELSSDAEFQEYRRLEQFHYKGIDLSAGGSSDSVPKGSGGRKAILLATFSRNGVSRALGYIEIQMPLLMCKPRHDFFDRPFASGMNNISWNTWLGDGQKYVNRIARIARVVVDPEFRGIGLSTILVEKAKDFCRERWHIGGNRPLFLEISAEMLRYMDFVSRAGLQFVGQTEGNLQRIARDLNSIEKGASGKSGIMSLQRKYHSTFMAYCESTGCTFDEARIILADLLTSEDPRSEMASDEWLAFRPILRLPIPYFIGGLNPDSIEYVSEGVKALHRADPKELHTSTSLLRKKLRGNSENLTYTGIQVSVDYEIPLTSYVRLIMDSFGIETNRVHTRIVGPVDITLVQGMVSLITGASGAGKSVLLQALSGVMMADGLIKTVEKSPQLDSVRSLSPLPDKIPIFQYFANLYGPERAFDALCHVGLSEAMIFIKPFELLSVGQKYRAMFADLILSDADLWLIDEFCSNLDPITSKILAARLRKLAVANNCTIVVAAANTTHFIDALNPNKIFVVRIGGEVTEMGMKEYNNGFFNKGF
ncbi:GNAT family N-acetyltransferase [Janthinobacterium lividum]|uniref:GNAT family N-acetyltransferase n=1 Tax=Janthinobacterium lividum TaxID=29581 RepID=UPI00044FE61C|nr:GNAT family N-acetyltransferase [Janthinobacterium lividum]EZP42010.1 ABC-type phosphate/phosphonate transport system, ATPase component [Janthinobacterium lividum]